MNESRSLSRRDALKQTSVLAAAALLGGPADLFGNPLAPDGGGPPAASLPLIALNRLAFGPRPGSFDFNTFNSQPGATDEAKLTNFIEWQLYPVLSNDPEYLARRAAAGATTLTKSLPTLWAHHVLGATGTNASNIRNQPIRETRADTMLRALYSQWQLYEGLVWFWHNHFSIYGWVSAIAPVWVHYDRDVIRAHALGNFRSFIEAVAKSTAMLFYLDNATSQGAQFNENFARELCELHTLGAENYLGVVSDPQSIPAQAFSLPSPPPAYWSAPPSSVAIGYCDNDVYEVARCLTGWRVNNGSSGAPGNDGTFLYHTPWHDRANKIVLGRYFQPDAGQLEDGYKALDLLAYHPGTAAFVSRKLCARFVGDNPPQALVDAAAAEFIAQRAQPDQLRRVVRLILQSPEFRTTYGAKVRQPAEAAIAMLRATLANFQPNSSVEFSSTHPLWSRYDNMGQQMFGRRSPDGYPDVKEAWTGTTSMLYRWRLCNDLIEGRITGTNHVPTTTDLVAQTPSNLTTPSAIVDFWIARLYGAGYPMPAENRTELLKMMSASYPNAPNDNALTPTQINDRLKRMVALILMSPDFQWR